jgi:hypothetical protein
MNDTKYVIAVGNAFDGLSMIGPFDTFDDALDHAEQLEGHPEYVVCELEKP